MRSSIQISELLPSCTFSPMQHIYACDTTIAVGFVLSQFKFKYYIRHQCFLLTCWLITLLHTKRLVTAQWHYVNMQITHWTTPLIWQWGLFGYYLICTSKQQRGLFGYCLTCTSKLLCPFSGGLPDKTYSASSWLWAFMVTMCTQNRGQQLC